MKLNLITCFMWMLCISSLAAQGTEFSCRLLDTDNYPVAFYLKGSNGTVLKSDKNGVMKVSQSQIQSMKAEVFSLHFSNTMAYQLYKSHLYFSNGQMTTDPHFNYDSIKLPELLTGVSKTYFVRRLELRLEGKKDKH